MTQQNTALESPALNKAMRAWLRNSLVHHLREHERSENKCRKAYKPDTPIGDAAEALAKVHGEAAAVYRRALAEIDGDEP